MYRRHLVVVDAAVPLFVVAVITVGEAIGSRDRTSSAVVVLGVAAGAVLWGRRRFPVATLVVSGALAAALFHLDQPAGVVAVFSPAVALFALALRRGRPAQMLAGAAAVVAVIMADVMSGGSPTVPQTLGHVLLVSIPLLAAEVMRTHRSYLEVLEERLALAEQTSEREAEHRAEQERLRIARELHDLAAHTLTEINVQAGAAAEQLAPGPARAALERIEDASHRAMGELRAVLGVLRSPSQVASPLLPAPGVEDLPGLVDQARSSGLDVALRTEGEPPSQLSNASSLAVYRIVQESLTNARRHAPGAPARVEGTFGAEEILILVENPNSRPTAEGAGSGVGVQGMAERASAVGGTLHAGPEGDRFAVHAKLPYLRQP